MLDLSSMELTDAPTRGWWMTNLSSETHDTRTLLYRFVPEGESAPSAVSWSLLERGELHTTIAAFEGCGGFGRNLINGAKSHDYTLHSHCEVVCAALNDTFGPSGVYVWSTAGVPLAHLDTPITPNTRIVSATASPHVFVFTPGAHVDWLHIGDAES